MRHATAMLPFLGALLASGLFSPCNAQEKKPLLLVRFVAVAKPPLPKISGKSGDAHAFKIQDPGAILPPDIMLGDVIKEKGAKEAKTSYKQSLNLMLNVASRVYRVKSPSLVLMTKGSAGPFAKITLPRTAGSFTVYMARQPNKKNWDNAQVIVLETPMSTTGKASPRLINFTPDNIGVILSKSKKPHVARQGKAAIIKAPSKLSHIRGFAYRQKQSKWQKIQQISAPFTKDILLTFVCYPGVPGSQKDCVLIDRVRRESLTKLAARAKQMDELDKMSRSTVKPEQE